MRVTKPIRRIIGTVICVLVIRYAPRRYEVEAWAELERLWS